MFDQFYVTVVVAFHQCSEKLTERLMLFV